MAKRTLGGFMSELRKTAGYTQQEVAEKLNVSNRTLSSWETDRTLPDVLMLPAIADLYGVTADELLRGERNPCGLTDTEISEKSQRLARRNRYGKFNIYTDFAFLCGLIFLLGGILLTFAEIPFLADLIILLVGGLGVGVFIICIFFEYCNVKTADGIVTGEDSTVQKKSLILVLKRNVSICLAITSLPFIFGLIVFALNFGARFGNGNKLAIITEYEAYVAAIALICIYSAFALILLLTALLFANLKYTALANERQIAVRKANAKLTAKIFGFGAIPIAVTLILATVFAYVQPQTAYCVYRNESYEDFRNQMQTLTVDGVICGNAFLGLGTGEYTFDLPKSDAEAVVGFDAGYGVKFKSYNYVNDALVCWLYRETNGFALFEKFDAFEFIDETGNLSYVVNLAYFDQSGYDIRSNGVREKLYYVVIFDEGRGYSFERRFYKDYSLPFLYLFIATVAATVAAGVTAYIIKRKKQTYEI